MNQKHLLLLCAIYTLVVSVLYAGGPYSLTPTQYEIDTAISSVTASLATKATSASVTASLDTKAGTSGAGVASTAFSTALGITQVTPRNDCRRVYQFWKSIDVASYTSASALFDVTSPNGSVVIVRGAISMHVNSVPYTTKAFEIAFFVGGYPGTLTVDKIFEGSAHSQDAGTMTIGTLVWTFDGTTLSVDPNISGVAAGDTQYPILMTYEITVLSGLGGTSFTAPTVTAR